MIDALHISEPGLVMLDITAAGEQTALALMGGLQQLWATSGNTTIRRDPDQPGVRARVHADIRTGPPRNPAAAPARGNNDHSC